METSSSQSSHRLSSSTSPSCPKMALNSSGSRNVMLERLSIDIRPKKHSNISRQLRISTCFDVGQLAVQPVSSPIVRKTAHGWRHVSAAQQNNQSTHSLTLLTEQLGAVTQPRSYFVIPALLMNEANALARVPLTSPLLEPLDSPKTSRNFCRLLPMAADTCNAASKPGPSPFAFGLVPALFRREALTRIRPAFLPVPELLLPPGRAGNRHRQLCAILHSACLPQDQELSVGVAPNQRSQHTAAVVQRSEWIIHVSGQWYRGPRQDPSAEYAQ